MSADGLFELPAGAVLAPAEPEPPLSADRRRTIRQLEMLRRGRHPIGDARLHPDAPPADDRDASGPRCGSCWYRATLEHHRKTWPKCLRSDGIWLSHSASSDVRAWWPACRYYSPGDPSLSADAARFVPSEAS